MSEPQIVMGYITCENGGQATDIARTLVKERLAACANIIPVVNSIYYWQGKLCRDTEALCLIKTRAGLMDAVIGRVKELHSYDLPCVVFYPAAGGLSEYLNWIKDETHQKNR